MSARSSAAGAMAHRLDILLRTIVAIAGGYILASLIAAVLARLIPGDRAEAALAGTITSFAVFPLVVMYVFAIRRSWIALVTLAAAALALWALVAWSIAAGGRL